MSSTIPLTSAVTSGDEQAVSALLAKGADVNETTSGGQSALILAVIFGHTNLVKLLMNAGADPHLRDNLGLNAIEWAQRRGLTEAVAILTNNSQSSTPPTRILIPLEEPKKAVPEAPKTKPNNESKEPLSQAEKSARWLAGVKQRLDEQALRRLNRNEPAPEQPRPVEENPPLMSVASRQTPVTEEPPKAPEPEAVKREPVKSAAAPRILTPPPTPPATTGKRKRCPQCNAIYTSDLVAYCAHHIVPLVDADDPIFSEPPSTKSNPPLFWILLVITLTGSIVVGSLITTYVYKRQAATRNAAAQQTIIQKGTPELSPELAGKAVSLPEAEAPVKGTQPVAGTVAVHVMVDKNGQVYWARGSGGDWLMRGAANEAAMKSTFAPDKLRGRGIEGTITYTFK